MHEADVVLVLASRHPSWFDAGSGTETSPAVSLVFFAMIAFRPEGQFSASIPGWQDSVSLAVSCPFGETPRKLAAGVGK
jgi:hypothetical protein